MTTEDAAKVLNEHRHRGHSKWYVSGNDGEDCFVMGEDRYEAFTPFEAVAIAEKYVTNSPKD